MSRPTPPPRGAAKLKHAVAWTGGALFVLSLAYFVYFYLFVLDDPSRLPAAASTAAAVAVDLGLFTLFAAHHSLLARTSVKRHVVRLAGHELERSIYTWVSSLLFLLVCASWRNVPGTAYAVDGSLRWVLYGMQGVGVAVVTIATRSVDALDLAGIRQVQETGRAPSSASPRLQTGGVYRIVRHPIYLGWALFVFGSPDMTWNRFTFACVSTAYLALAVPWEERSLIETFGEDYRRYRRRVRWRMVPWVY